jgi:hypothetical protein
MYYRFLYRAAIIIVFIIGIIFLYTVTIKFNIVCIIEICLLLHRVKIIIVCIIGVDVYFCIKLQLIQITRCPRSKGQ